MSYTEKDIRRLFARSLNQCAMPKCQEPIINGGTIVGEVCHIRARRKNGPRFDPNLSAAERDSYTNLLLLCRTCHKLVDSEKKRYTVDLLDDIKRMQERDGGNELTAQASSQAKALFAHLSVKKSRKVSAKAGDHGIALSIGGDNHAPITINPSSTLQNEGSKNGYPPNSIGADANLDGYIEYLVERAEQYWAGTTTTPGRIGKKIKTYLRIGPKRKRGHAPVAKFYQLVDFIITEVLQPSPVGKRQQRLGKRVCSTFDEWRAGR